MYFNGEVWPSKAPSIPEPILPHLPPSVSIYGLYPSHCPLLSASPLFSRLCALLTTCKLNISTLRLYFDSSRERLIGGIAVGRHCVELAWRSERYREP